MKTSVKNNIENKTLLPFESRVFTFTYFSGEGALENPARAYFEDVQIVQANATFASRTKTAECEKLISKGYVFSEWLGMTGLALYVLPSLTIRSKANKIYGYDCTSLQLNKSGRVVWSGMENTINHTMTAVAGDIDNIDSFNSFVIQCLYRSKNEHLYYWIGKITNQNSVIEDYKNGHYRDWFLFSSHTCFVRKNWPCEENKIKCVQCGEEH